MSTSNQLSGYQLRLAGFEGPLDVLLRLIEQQKLSISDISLAAVASGFLEYIDGLENPPPQLLADFVRVASKLLVIKTRSLLPTERVEEDEPSSDELAIQLREYQQAKRLAQRLDDAESKSWRAYARPPVATERPVQVRLKAPPLGRLRELLERVHARQAPDAGIATMRRIVSVAEMTRRLLGAALRAQAAVRFQSVVRLGDRQEIVAAFIALLALWSGNRLQVEQRELFGELTFQVAPAAADDGNSS